MIKPNRKKLKFVHAFDCFAQIIGLALKTNGRIWSKEVDAIICRYFYSNSWAEMKNSTRTEMDAKFDVKCGLAALHVRYGFIEFNSN